MAFFTRDLNVEVLGNIFEDTFFFPPGAKTTTDVCKDALETRSIEVKLGPLLRTYFSLSIIAA